MATREIEHAATTIVLTLLGGRLVYPQRVVVDRHYHPTSRLHLSGRPVREVLSVTSADGPVEYTYLGNGSVLLLGDQGRTARMSDPFKPRNMCKTSEYYVDVEYICGASQLPPAVASAVDMLACEMEKAQAGEPCSLPERLTSISRQGLSWTVMDPQDFLTEGRTGIYSIDLLISAYNRSYARARARVFSPEFRPPIRLSEELLTADLTAKWR